MPNKNKGVNHQFSAEDSSSDWDSDSVSVQKSKIDSSQINQKNIKDKKVVTSKNKKKQVDEHNTFSNVLDGNSQNDSVKERPTTNLKSSKDSKVQKKIESTSQGHPRKSSAVSNNDINFQQSHDNVDSVPVALSFPQKNIRPGEERYYFDHGNTEYFELLLPTHQNSYLNIIADQTQEKYLHWWTEILSSFRFLFDFITAFILSLFTLIFLRLIRPLLVDFLRIVGETLVKPLLATLFNGFIQPFLLYLQNFFNLLANAMEPLFKILQGFVKPFVNLLSSIRLVNVNITYQNSQSAVESV